MISSKWLVIQNNWKFIFFYRHFQKIIFKKIRGRKIISLAIYMNYKDIKDMWATQTLWPRFYHSRDLLVKKQDAKMMIPTVFKSFLLVLDISQYCFFGYKKKDKWLTNQNITFCIKFAGLFGQNLFRKYKTQNRHF